MRLQELVVAAWRLRMHATIKSRNAGHHAPHSARVLSTSHRLTSRPSAVSHVLSTLGTIRDDFLPLKLFDASGSIHQSHDLVERLRTDSN